MSPARSPRRRPADSAADRPRNRTAQWYRHFGTVDAPGNSACYAEWAVGIAGDAGTDPADRRVAAQQAPAAADARGGPVPRRADQPLPATSGLPGPALGGRLADCAFPRPRRPTRPDAAPRCCRSWRRSPPPRAARWPSSRWAPRPGLPCSRTATATSSVRRAGFRCRRGCRRGCRCRGARTTRLFPAGAAPGTFPVLRCATTGPVPLPAELPRVVWRAGIDLNPLDVRRPGRRRLAGGPDLAGAGLPPRAAAPGDRRRPGRPAAPGGRGPQRPAPRPGRRRRRRTPPWWCSTAPSWPTSTPRPGTGSAAPWRGSPANAAATGSPTRATR